MLVVGMPNVGKSSLLNALRRVGVRKGKAFNTGAMPGVTRKLTGTVKVYERPPVYVFDTPGVMVPYLGHSELGAERGLKLALTAGIKDGLFEPEIVADYLLYKLNLRLASEGSFPPQAEGSGGSSGGFRRKLISSFYIADTRYAVHTVTRAGGRRREQRHQRVPVFPRRPAWRAEEGWRARHGKRARVLPEELPGRQAGTLDAGRPRRRGGGVRRSAPRSTCTRGAHAVHRPRSCRRITELGCVGSGVGSRARRRSCVGWRCGS